MKNYISNAIKNINGDYINEEYFKFAIVSYDFNLDEGEPKLIVKVGYYNDNTKEIIISFKSVYSHNVMSESFIYCYEDEMWEEVAFFSIFNCSRYEKFIKNSSLLNVQLEFTDVKQIYHFRISGQNFFIDVLTSEYPDIIVKKLLNNC